MAAARAVIETLLRERKLDVTLTSARPWVEAPEDRLAPTGVPAIDGPLGGGLRRGHLSEIVGARSSGRTTLMDQVLAAATARGEVVALIDTCDRFDPAAAAGSGVDLSRLLWVRDRGDAARALKAVNLIIQAGGFGIVAFDLADVPGPAVRQFPYTTWMRLSRVIEGSQTTLVLLGADRIARSSGGATIALQKHARPEGRAYGSPRPEGRACENARPEGRACGSNRGRWKGEAERARHLTGLDIQPRVVAGR